MSDNKKQYLLVILLVATSASFFLSQTRSAFSAGLYDGLWEGNFDINGKGNYRFTTLYVDGVAIGHSADARVIYKGEVSFKDARYRSYVNMFFMTGSPMDQVTLEGILSGDGRIEATYRTHGAGDKGKLILDRKAGKGADLSTISGSWILYQGYSILKLDVDGNGTISAGNTAGCAYDGAIKPINSEYNAYDIKLAITSCDNLNGIWAGMAYLSDGIKVDDTLNLHLFEEDWAMLLPIVRNTDTRLIDKHKQWKP